ncbi:2-hydroxy-3-oxopropionate reductase [Kribbella sp. NPDC056951]|uniref:2-hydroxy-3-oxopropionate reductase n=1 Tax=Kribbella sp. NPDC056951 TaxID=3345978 RepID=UPI00362ECF4A
MTAIGFIGLGIMGSHMAANLIAAGHAVTGYDVVPAAVDRLAQAGGKPAPDIASAVAGAEVVITMLPDSPQVAEVVLGPDGVLSAIESGVLLIDMSSIAPETSIAVAAAGAERGVQVLDAPVSGGEQGAIKASLSIMVGGSAEDFETARPIFEALGRTIVHVGPHGSGQTVKAANQLMVAGIISLVSEAIVLLEASGVDSTRGLEVLAGGLAGNRILDLKSTTMLAREFTPGFRIDLHHKDMGIALASARAAGVSLPVTGVVAQLVAAARSQGHGSLDHSALLKTIESLSR